MKVLLLNGSPRKEGCTFTALSEVAKTLNHNGIDTEIFQAGNPDTDNVKAAAAKLKEADALIVGSPVYWASPSGQIIEFMDKLCSMAGKDMLHKPAAAVASATTAFSSAVFQEACNRKNITFQKAAAKSALRTGGTISAFMPPQVEIKCVAIGISTWAMHSAYESCGTADLFNLIGALKSFWLMRD